MSEPQRRASDPNNIVLHIIEHVDARLGEHQRTTTDWLVRHEREELVRYDEIRMEIKEGQDASERRHNALLQSINAYMEKMDVKMHESPCPHLADSIPEQDWSGHRGYHEDEMNWNTKINEFKWYIVKVVAGAGGVAFLGWLGVLAWVGFLKGPN